jgi:hypothetical protein
VQRILQAGDVRPHRVQQWLHSPDPAFREKVNVICKLYRKAPKNAVVLSIDGKTGIQAIERKHPGRAPAAGRLRRREFEYIRHGTQSLIAALDVHTGRVLGSCRDRRQAAIYRIGRTTISRIRRNELAEASGKWLLQTSSALQSHAIHHCENALAARESHG